MPPESGDHLIEDEDCPVVVGELLEPVQETRGGRLVLFGLEDDAGDPPRVRREEVLHAPDIVVAEPDGEVFRAGRDARRHGGAADEPIVDREERLVRANGHHVPARVSPGQLDRAARRIGPVLAELDHVGAFDDRKEFLGALELDTGRPDIVVPQQHLTVRGLHDGLERMTQRHRP